MNFMRRTKNETMNNKCPYSKNKICSACKVLEVVLPLVFWTIVIVAFSLSIYLFSEDMISEAVCLSSVAIATGINYCFFKH